MARRPLSFWVSVVMILIELAQRLEALFDCDEEEIKPDGKGNRPAA